MIRIGQGYDVHELVPGRPLIIGGVELSFAYGLKGHSDADVLLHAITDALIGALGRGDIGHAFPDTNPELEGIASTKILASIYEEMKKEGYRVGNIDATILAERPKMAPHLPTMKEKIAQLLHMEVKDVNLKATTTEKLGFIGREEGMAAQAVILLVKEEA